MSAPKSRDVLAYWEAEEGEVCDFVTVEPESYREARVTTDLDALGIPESEQEGVRERAVEAYWEAERKDWLRTREAEEAGE